MIRLEVFKVQVIDHHIHLIKKLKKVILDQTGRQYRLKNHNIKVKIISQHQINKR